MYKLLAGLLLLVQSLSAQNTISSTGSNIKSKDAEAILAHHNKVRAEVGAPALAWSRSLSAYAQKWADHLAALDNGTLEHRDVSGENGKIYGENLFWGSSAAAYPPVQASYNWYDEKKMYKYRKLNGSNWHKTGHYTQMIWKTTQEMGVGVAVSASGAVIVVANYYPAGNVINQYPY
ncbi:CAP family protein [Ferruginibacter sp.]